MPAFQLHLGSESFLQLKAGTRLGSQASVVVSTEAAHVNGLDFNLSSFLGRDLWTRAKPCFTVSFFVTVDESLMFPFGSQPSFLKQLGKTLCEAEVRG